MIVPRILNEYENYLTLEFIYYLLVIICYVLFAQK
jgi:hypothetical protein